MPWRRPRAEDPGAEEPVFGEKFQPKLQSPSPMKMNICRSSLTSAATLLAGSLLLVPVASAATTVLDNFNSSIFSVNTGGPLAAGPTPILGDSGILGVNRQVSIGVAAGTGSASSGNNLDVLVYDNGALMRSILTFQYTLPAYNLSLSGATSFSYLLQNTELGKDTDYTLTILSADGSATATGTLPVLAGLVHISLASLTTVGTPFDDMTSLTVQFSPQVNGTDMVIDAFGFDLVAPPIPEPSTYAAIGFAGVLACWTYRRRAMSPAVVATGHSKS
jgi:hypothetical protein